MSIINPAKFTTDESLNMSEENVLSVSAPVRSIISADEFSALPESEKSKGLWVVTETTAEKIWWSPHMTSDESPYPYNVSIAIPSKYNQTHPPYAIFDGNPNTGGSGFIPWLLFDFGKLTTVYGVRIYPCAWHPTASIKSVTIQGSYDGVTFFDIASIDRGDDNSNSYYSQPKDDLFGDGYTLRYIRFYNPTSDYSIDAGTNEIYFLIDDPSFAKSVNIFINGTAISLV